MPLNNQIIVPRYLSGDYNEIVLTPQQISAVALTGNETISGVKTFDVAPIVSGNRLITGLDLNSYATTINLFDTGSILDNKINSLSGSLSGTLTGNYVTKFNGQFTNTPTVNGIPVLLSGQADVLLADVVFTTGNQNIGGNKNFYTRPTVNGTGVLLSGEAINFTLPNNIVYTTGNQIISGTKTFIENTVFGDPSQGDFLVISGNTFSIYGSGNFTSGLFVNGNPVLTGVDLSSYATNVNLFTTGSILDDKINALSGYVTGTNATFTTNLFSTGSTLDNKINALSGYVSGISLGGLLPNSIVYITGDQTINGIKTFANNLEVQGTGIFNALDLSNISEFNFSGTNINLINGNVNISGQIYISGNPVLTGVNLSSYATIANLALTGSTLDTKINNLSGVSVLTFGDQNISGNKNFLNNIGVSGTGVFSAIDLNNIDILTLSGVDITITNGVVTLTNPVSAPNLVYNTGNQTIAGNKNFLNNINISGNVNVTGRVVASTGIFGLNNNISGLWLTMAGGSGNIITANHSVINGGQGNRVSGNFSVIGGGRSNFIAAGMSNDFSVIGGGLQNIVCGGGASYGATIGGGCFNVAYDGATVGGGVLNVAVGSASFIGGGCSNCAAGRNSFIGAGCANCAAFCHSSVVGGFGNYACSVGSSIVGGTINTICGGTVRADFSFIGGGRNNTIGDLFPAHMGWNTIAGGYGNKISSSISAYASTIGGGECNCICNAGCSIIAGGLRNCICSIFSTIGGGECNCAFGNFSFVGGGGQNFSSGIYSSTVGGLRNRTCGDYNFAGGGNFNCAVIGGCASVVGGSRNCATGAASFIGGGSVNIAGGIYSSTVGGFINNVQACNAFIGGGENNTIVLGAFAGFIGGGSNNTLGATYLSTIGGYMSTIGGGSSNVAAGERSAILGGSSNFAFGEFSAIIGGQGNSNCGRASVIGGGSNNFIFGPSNSSINSFIGGGAANRIYRDGGSIPGGQANVLSGIYSATLGGFGNEIYSEYSFAIGGRRASVLRNHDGAGILGDGQNRDHRTSGCHSLVIDFASGVYFASPQIYGSLIFNSPVNAINRLTATSGLDLNNSNLINATPQIINLSSNFNISGDYNSRMIMVNSANEVTGTIISGNSLGFNATIMQVNSGQVLITGAGIGVKVNEYANQYRTAGAFAAVTILHTGSNGYIMYGNTAP